SPATISSKVPRSSSWPSLKAAWVARTWARNAMMCWRSCSYRLPISSTCQGFPRSRSRWPVRRRTAASVSSGTNCTATSKQAPVRLRDQPRGNIAFGPLKKNQALRLALKRHHLRIAAPDVPDQADDDTRGVGFREQRQRRRLKVARDDPRERTGCYEPDDVRV